MTAKIVAITVYDSKQGGDAHFTVRNGRVVRDSGKQAPRDIGKLINSYRHANVSVSHQNPVWRCAYHSPPPSGDSDNSDYQFFDIEDEFCTEMPTD